MPKSECIRMGRRSGLAAEGWRFAGRLAGHRVGTPRPGARDGSKATLLPPPGIAWRRVGLRRDSPKGEWFIREGPSNSGSQAQARGLGAGAIASLTGVGLLLIFMFQNTENVRLDFLFWGFTWPLWLLTLASAFLGALVWFGIGVMRRHRRRKERRQDRRG